MNEPEKTHDDATHALEDLLSYFLSAGYQRSIPNATQKRHVENIRILRKALTGVAYAPNVPKRSAI